MLKEYLLRSTSEGVAFETAGLAVSEGATVLTVARDSAELAAAENVAGESVPVAAIDLAEAAALEFADADWPRCRRRWIILGES
jgi:NADP-dependent 3-hydroxy acid dehydrogenase YdfG